MRCLIHTAFFLGLLTITPTSCDSGLNYPRKALGRALKQSSISSGSLYTIQNVGRASCDDYLSVTSCDALTYASSDDGSGKQRFGIETKNAGLLITNPTCGVHLVIPSCDEDAVVDLSSSEGSKSNDACYFNGLGNNEYNIQNNQARSGCSQVLSSSGCDDDISFTFNSGDTGSGREQWKFTEVSGSTSGARRNEESLDSSQTISSPAEDTQGTENTQDTEPSSPSQGEEGSSPQQSSPDSDQENSPSINEESRTSPQSESSSPTASESPDEVTNTGDYASSCTSKKGVVYDFFFQYCQGVTLTESAWWLNFDSEYDSSCSDPNVIERHQPMIWGSDRIQSGYDAIINRPDYAKLKYLMTFNEPNYAYGGGNPSNILSPQEAAALWPQITSLFDPLNIQLIAPSPIDCAGDDNCKNVGSVEDWLDQFREGISDSDWNAIHALNYHTYATDSQTIIGKVTSLYNKYQKPIWITELAAGGSSSKEENLALMEDFIPWAESSSMVERYFWNQATRPLQYDANIQNSYLIDKSSDGSGDGKLTTLGSRYAQYPSNC